MYYDVLWCIIKSLYNDKVNLRDLNLGKKRNFNFFGCERMVWQNFNFYFGKRV